MCAVEEYRLPQSEQFEGIAHVVVRASVGILRVVRIRILRIRPGVVIHGLRPGVGSVELETMRHLLLHTGVERVVALSRVGLGQELGGGKS